MNEESYGKGRRDVLATIREELHKRLIEEMNKPYQDQGFCEGLYFGIQRCDWYLYNEKEIYEENLKEQKNE